MIALTTQLNWLEFLTATPILFGLAPAITAALIGVGGGILSNILNRPSGAEQSALAVGTAASQAQADEIRRQTAARAFLEQLLRRQLGAEFPREALFQFPEEAGGPALDIDMLGAQADIFGRGAALDRLLALAGLPAGTNIASQSLAQGLAGEQRERQSRTDFVSALAQLLLSGALSGGGGGGGGGTVLPPPGTGATDF